MHKCEGCFSLTCTFSISRIKRKMTSQRDNRASCLVFLQSWMGNTVTPYTSWGKARDTEMQCMGLGLGIIKKSGIQKTFLEVLPC